MTREEFNATSGHMVSEEEWAEISAVMGGVSLDDTKQGGAPCFWGLLRALCNKYQTADRLWMYNLNHVEELEDAIFAKDEAKVFEAMYKHHAFGWVIERKMRGGFAFTEGEIQKVAEALKKA